MRQRTRPLWSRSFVRERSFDGQRMLSKIALNVSIGAAVARADLPHIDCRRVALYLLTSFDTETARGSAVTVKCDFCYTEVT